MAIDPYRESMEMSMATSQNAPGPAVSARCSSKKGAVSEGPVEHGVYPLVIEHSYGKSPCLMGKFTISMAIVNSYV